MENIEARAHMAAAAARKELHRALRFDRWQRPNWPKWNERVYIVCAGITCGILFICWRVLHAVWKPLQPHSIPTPGEDIFATPNGLNGLQFDWVLPSDPHAKRMAYNVMWVSVIAAMVIGKWIMTKWKPRLRWTAMAAWLIPLGIGLGIFAGFVRSPRLSRLGMIIGVGLIVLIAVSRMVRRSFWMRAGLELLTWGFVAAIILPGIGTRLDCVEQGWYPTEHSEQHYAFMVSVGDRLAAGFKLFDEVMPNYGIAMPLLGAAMDRIRGATTMGNYVTMILWLQAIYILLALVCYRWLCGRHKVVLLAVSFFAFYHYHYNEFYMLYPNHTAWRYMGFALMLFLLTLIRRWRPETASVALGACAVLSLLINLETGVAISAGLLAYLAFQFRALPGRRLPMQSFKRLAAFGGGGLAAAIGFALAFRAIVGQWLDPRGMTEYLKHLRLVSATGFGTFSELPFNAMALLMFAHAMVALLYTWFASGQGNSARNSFRAAVSVTLMVWFAYYLNRPSPECLYCYHVLYAALLADTLRTFLVLRRRWWAPSTLAACLALVVVIAPFVRNQAHYDYVFYENGPMISVKLPYGVLVSGVWLPNDSRTKGIIAKSKFIESVGSETRPIYLSRDAYLIAKASGVWPHIPFVNPYAEVQVRQDYQRLLKSIIDSDQQAIYIDDPASVPFKSLQGTDEYFNVLRRDLSGYFRFDGVVDGWQRWTRSSRG